MDPFSQDYAQDQFYQSLSPFSREEDLTPEQQYSLNQTLPDTDSVIPPSPRKNLNLGFKALDALGFVQDLSARPNQQVERQRMLRANNTDTMAPVSNPGNPFGNYTPNAGVGGNFQPNKQVATQRWGYAEGGQAGPPNKTQQYLQGMSPEQPGQQEFWREAINDIPHPLEPNKHLSYGQMQQMMQGPQRKQVLEQYAQQQHLDRAPSPEQYLQGQFSQGQQRLLARAQQDPTQYAFPSQADEARQAVLRPLSQKAASIPQPTLPGQVTNPQIRAAQFAARGATGAGYAAPGMSMAKMSFAQGGEYNLSPWEIASLRAQGYELDELD